MAINLVSRVAIFGIVFVAIAYQFLFKYIIFEALGYGRKVLSIQHFENVQCEKVTELGLEGCEDMWLHWPTGFLYMACSDSQSRTQWVPAVGLLNATGRGLTDRIAVLDTRGQGRLASRIKWLTVENFSGIKGDKTMNLHGFDIRADEHSDTLHILLVNHRPPLDPETGEPLDATIVGANSTIEHFQTEVGGDAMRHMKTYADPLIQTPNRAAWINNHSFVFTNDHGGKVGLRRELDPFMGGGSIGYCNQSTCSIVYSGLKVPNGLVQGRDGLVYVPCTLDGTIKVFKLSESHLLVKVNEIKVPLPIDNLSVDENGDIYAATLPKVYIWAESTKNPFNINPPAAVFRIQKSGRKIGGETNTYKETDAIYVVDKVLEDNGSILPGATTAVHDTETGRIFLSGVMSPFIAICEPTGHK